MGLNPAILPPVPPGGFMDNSAVGEKEGVLLGFNASTLELEWSTNFGGDVDDEIRGLATDEDGNLFFTGLCTSSLNFPSQQMFGAYYENPANNRGVIVGAFEEPEMNLSWSTILGQNIFTQLIFADGISMVNDRLIIIGSAGAGYLTVNPGSPAYFDDSPQASDIIITEFDFSGLTVGLSNAEELDSKQWSAVYNNYYIAISSEDNINGQFFIFDTQGKVVQSSFVRNVDTHKISCGSFTNGVYLLMLVESDSSYGGSQKLIIHD